MGEQRGDGPSCTRLSKIYAQARRRQGLRTHAVGGLRFAVCTRRLACGWSVGRPLRLCALLPLFISYLQVQNVTCVEVGIFAACLGTLGPERARTSHPTSRVWRRAVHPICWEAVTPAYSFWLKACGVASLSCR